MRCMECRGKTKVHKTVKRHELYVLRTRECLACGDRVKTLEMHVFMPMAQAVLHTNMIHRCERAVNQFNKVWRKAKEQATRYRLVKR